MARGARSQANLRRGNPGNKSRPRQADEEKARAKEVQKIARKLLDPTYVRNLKARLRTGKIQPGVEVAIWQYAFGKPQETVDTKQPVPVRIVHEFAEIK